MTKKGGKAKPAAKKAAKKAATKKAATKKTTTQQRRQAQPGYAATLQLRAQILELRTLGRTIPQIAEQVDRSVSTVHGHLTRALEELNAEQQEKAGQLQSLAYNRLERMLARAMLKAVTGDLKAMREATRLIQAQARLMGWGMPAARNPETGTGFGDGATTPPGQWTLPMRPDTTIEQWAAEAEAAWQAQQQREAEALGGS